MNVEHAPTTMTESRERHSYARMPGRWLLLARGVWIVLVILTLGTYFASLSDFMSQLHTPCYGPACAYGMRLTPEQAGALTGMGLSLGDHAAFTVALTLATMVVCLVVSTLIIWRRPDDRMAFLVALMLVTLGPINATNSMSAIPSPWQLPNTCLYFLALALVLLVFSLFPTGQFVPSFTRWTLVVCLAGQVPYIFFPLTPFTLSTQTASLGWLLLLGELAILVVVQFYRYRRLSGPLQRQQIKWVVFGLAVIGTVTVVGYGLLPIFPALDNSSSPAGSIYQLALNDITLCLLLLIPLSFGFALLRYRLWDVDVLINRTLVYGALTVSLALVYVGLVIGLQVLLHGLLIQQTNGNSWPPHWLSTFSSSRFVDGSSGSLTGASIAASMTPPKPWQPSAPPCARKWTWTNCANSCWLWCKRRCSQPMSRCGCVHLNMMENSGFLGEQLLFLLREAEEVQGFLASLYFRL
jgi:hypothetical protein